MKILIMQSATDYHHFLPVRCRYSPQHPILEHSQSTFFRYWNRPSFSLVQNYQYNYGSAYFMSLERKREDKRFWTEWYQAPLIFNLLLICSWMQFWSVVVVPKFLNFATFFKEFIGNQ